MLTWNISYKILVNKIKKKQNDKMLKCQKKIYKVYLKTTSFKK